MKIKIISDGTVCGTNVLNTETGEAIPWISGVRFCHDACGLPVTEISLNFVEIEAECGGSFWIGNRQVKSITFEDGEILNFS